MLTPHAQLGQAFCFVLDNRLGEGAMDGAEIAARLKGRTTAAVLLSSGDAFDTLPDGFTGQIEKRTYRPAELEAIVSATPARAIGSCSDAPVLTVSCRRCLHRAA